MLTYVIAFLMAGQTPRPPSHNVVNGWILLENEGACSATTDYQGGTTVHLIYDFGRNAVVLGIENPAWASIVRDRSYPITITFDNGNSYDRVSAAGYDFETTGARHMGVRLDLVGDEFLADFALANTATITMDGNRLAVLSLRGTRQVITRLAQCGARSFRQHPLDPFAGQATGNRDTPPDAARPARARANLSSYFSADDYPPASFRNREEGTVGYRLTIDASGRVSDCTITSTSSFIALDTTTCRILRSRARFIPAFGSNGNPTVDHVVGRQTWTLPD